MLHPAPDFITLASCSRTQGFPTETWKLMTVVLLSALQHFCPKHIQAVWTACRTLNLIQTSHSLQVQQHPHHQCHHDCLLQIHHGQHCRKQQQQNLRQQQQRQMQQLHQYQQGSGMPDVQSFVHSTCRQFSTYSASDRPGLGLKAALRQLYKRVHPDLFTDFPAEQVRWEYSLALHSLLVCHGALGAAEQCATADSGWCLLHLFPLCCTISCATPRQKMSDLSSFYK